MQMFMVIAALPSDNYEHHHVLRMHSADEATARRHLAQANPDLRILSLTADATPEMEAAAVAKIREEDPTHDPLHPKDLLRRDASKVKAEHAAAAAKALPLAHGAIAAAKEAHAKMKAPAAPAEVQPKPPAAPK